MAHVGGEAFDGRRLVAVPAQTLVDGEPKPLLHDVDMIVVHNQISTQILDLPPILRNDLGLVGLQVDGLHPSKNLILGGGHAPVGVVAVMHCD